MAWMTRGLKSGVLTTRYPAGEPEWATCANESTGRVVVTGDLSRTPRRFRHSIHIRHVDAGSDGAVEMEIAALLNPVYDVNRLGIYFTASPRHADMLMVTGCGAPGMSGPLRATYDAIPFPKLVMAVGSDCISGSPAGCQESECSGYGIAEQEINAGIAAVVPVDLYVPGSPPSPISILKGILVAMGVIPSDHGDVFMRNDSSGAARVTGGRPYRENRFPENREDEGL